MNKVGKTIRPFMYDLNQMPNDYTVEVRNGFKGFDLIDRVPEELWTLYRRQCSRASPQKIDAKSQIAVSEGLTNSCEKRSKKQRRKGKIHPFECRVQKNSKER